MNTPKIFLKISLLLVLLAVYLAGYGFLRYNGELIRIEGRSTERKNEILAKTGERDQLALDMAKNSNSPLLIGLEYLRQTKAPFLNGVFWLPRKLESALRNNMNF